MEETRNFQAEVSRLLDIVVHSIYSDKKVFLRELVSNASDACDRRRYAALTDPALGAANGTYHVILIPDEASKTLTIEDNGIAASPDPACVTSLRLFCAILGGFAGNVALTMGAHGGVMLGGGILPRLQHLLQESDFRRRFEARGRMSAYNQAIPTTLILAGDAALRGTTASIAAS